MPIWFRLSPKWLFHILDGEKLSFLPLNRVFVRYTRLIQNQIFKEFIENERRYATNRFSTRLTGS